MRLQLHLMQLHRIRQRQCKRQRRIISTEEVVGPGGGAHAAGCAGAAVVHVDAEEHVSSLGCRVAAGYCAW